MNRTSLTIQMLQILATHKRIKKTEIAELLEVNPRNIAEYKKELEIAGYLIHVYPGKEGGYELDRTELSTQLIPSVGLTEHDYSVLNISRDYLNKQEQFIEKKEYNEAISKILYKTIEIEEDQFDIYQPIHVSYNLEQLKQFYKELHHAIKNQLKVELTYKSKNIEKIRTIHPYYLYEYRRMWYCIVKGDHNDKFYHIKLNRIKKMSVLKEKYRFDETFDQKAYLNEFGHRFESINVTLKLLDSDTMISEYVYGRKQKVYEQDGVRYLSFEANSRERALYIIRGFGSRVEICEPAQLRKDYLKELESIKSLYNINNVRNDV